MNCSSEEPAVTPTGCVMSRLSASGPHRSSLWRRLRPRENAATLLRGARAAALALAALAVLALALPVQAQTQTPVQLVSTIEQTNVGSAPGPFELYDAAQAFTTGTDTNGYKLTSVDLRLYVVAGTSGWVYSVSVWSATATGSPNTSLGTLTNPTLATGTTAFTNYTFTESGNGIDLDASTTYVIVVDVTTRGTGTNTFSMSNTVSDDEDTVKATGWSIADGSLYRDWDSTGAWTTFDQTRRIRVNGTTNTAPTGAHKTVTIVSDRAYTFEADDFGFADTDTGDTLASVKIVTLPTPGTLALDGTAVLADAVVTKAQIDGNMLTFTSAAGASGTGYASFTFKVNDGTVDSASAYTMTIDVTTGSVCAVPDFGTRRNIWTGTVTVEERISGGVAVSYGFNAAASTGRLDPTGFSIGLNPYVIDSVSADAFGVDIRFGLTSSLMDTEVAALRLHICDTSYDFSDTTHISHTSTYVWTENLDWSTETTRTLYLSLPANNPATGTPTITGTAQVGQVLTADASPIMDDDGLPLIFTYQWLRVDADGTSNEEDITGEIAATYTLTDDDEGKKIKVKVSFTDELSGVEERTSAAYPSSGTVTAAASTNTPPTAANNTVTAVAGTAYAFEADDFGFADTDTGDTLASVTINQVVTKAQIDAGDLTFTPVDGASGTGYATFTFKVNDGTVDSASAYTMTIDARDLTCAAPDFAGDNRHQLWTGIVTVGDVRSVGYGFHSEESQTGLDDTTFAIGRNSYTIDHAFVLSVNPVGQLGFSLTGDIQNDNLTAGEVAALRLHVCDTVFYDFSAATSSGNENTYRWAGSLDWSPPVATRTLYLSLPANRDAMGAPAITGTARSGQELTAAVTGITDADGLTGDLSTLNDNVDGLGGVEYRYQWIRVDADGMSNPVDITGENSATYTLTDDDVGKKVKVKVSFTDDLNGEEELTSEAFPSSGTVVMGTTNNAPVFDPAMPSATRWGAPMWPLRWSWFVGQSKGKLKVYSDWFLALDERTLPMARDDVKGIVGSSVGALVKCRSVMTGSTLPVMINHFATAVAVSPEGPERSGGAA